MELLPNASSKMEFPMKYAASEAKNNSSLDEGIVICNSKEEMLEIFGDYKKQTRSGWCCLNRNKLIGIYYIITSMQKAYACPEIYYFLVIVQW